MVLVRPPLLPLSFGVLALFGGLFGRLIDVLANPLLGLLGLGGLLDLGGAPGSTRGASPGEPAAGEHQEGEDCKCASHIPNLRA